MIPALKNRRNGGGTVREIEAGLWRLELPSGPSGMYRWAQLDDYLHRARKDFPWNLGSGQSGLALDLRARVSAPDLPGTWGFGFWNDPFNASLGVGGTAARLPALPNTAWYFYAAPPNYLAFHDTHPAQGLLAATFAAPRIPSLLLAPGALALPVLAVPALARMLRGAARMLIRDDGDLIPVDPTIWHSYRLDWREDRVNFFIDGGHIFSSPVSPVGPLGLAIWIDNQYAAFPPDGKLRQGTSPNNEPAWLEVEGIQVVSD